jgi:hypothetical protein
MGGVGISIPRSGYFLRGVPRLYNPDERSPKSDFAENQGLPGFSPLSWWHWKHLRKIHNVSNLEILEKLEKGRLYFPFGGYSYRPLGRYHGSSVLNIEDTSAEGTPSRQCVRLLRGLHW